MKNVYNWIIIIIFVFVLGQYVITQKRYDVLKQEYDELLIEKSNIIDSLENDNSKRIESIVILEKEVSDLNTTIDSLYVLKEDIEKSKSSFTTSISISEGSALLKQNLREKTTNYNI